VNLGSKNINTHRIFKGETVRKGETLKIGEYLLVN
jgi:hypothetical protein